MIPASYHTDRHIFQKSVIFSLGFTFLLWAIKAVEWSTATDLGVFGILPRTLTGIVGILTGPLIHGDTLHLLSNTFPLLLLLLAVFYFYDKIALEVFFWIYLITGFWVWLAARQAYHIGSSGLVYGLAAFLFFSGLFRKDARSIAVALCIAFLYGGMLQGLFPTSGGVSWESHLLGSAAGVFCSFYFRKNGNSQPKENQINVMQASSSFSAANNTHTEYVYTTDPFYHYSYIEKKGRAVKTYYDYKNDDKEGPTASKT